MPPAIDGNDVLAWKMNESSASWANLGTAGTLTLVPRTGATTPPTADMVSGDPAGTGYAYHGYGGRVHDNCAFSAADGSGTSLGEIATNITISMYLKLVDYQSSNYGGFIQKLKAAGAGDTAIQINYNNTNDGQWYTGINAGGTNQYLTNGTNMPTGTWCHIGFTYNGTSLKQYKNGVLLSTDPMSPSGSIGYDSHGPWIIGGSYSGYDNINGYIQDVRVANVVRDLAWFQSMTPGAGAGTPGARRGPMRDGFRGGVIL